MSDPETATPQVAEDTLRPDRVDRPRFVWWREAVYVIVFYLV